MENASKALIIAGAILLAILLISLGIMIFNQANGIISTNAMSEVEITQFNQKFVQYEGDKVRGTSVKSMLQPILSNNLSADSDDRKVEVYLGSEVILTKDATSVSAGKIKSGSTYKVKCEYSTSGGNTGLVNKVIITNLNDEDATTEED